MWLCIYAKHVKFVTDQSSGRYALVYACAVALRWPILASFFPRLCLIGFNYAQPFLISRAITFVGQNDGTKNDGYGLIGATGLIYLGIAVSDILLLPLLLGVVLFLLQFLYCNKTNQNPRYVPLTISIDCIGWLPCSAEQWPP